MYDELVAKREKYVTQARQALSKGDVETGAKLRQQAEKVQQAIDEGRKLDAMKAAPGGGSREPLGQGAQRPPMPGSSRNGAMPATPAAYGDAASSERAKSAYIIRFGTPEAAVKGILTDLHGNEYEAAYWHQNQAFRKFLRYGDQRLDSDEYGLLKSIILTPSVVKAAVGQGIDSVDSIKATMVEAIDTLGGFAVPVDFQARVLERLKGMTVMRGRASEDNTSRDTVEIPVSTGGDDQYTSAVRVTWVDETPTAGQAATNLTFGLERIPIHTVMAETGLSRNMVEDSAFDIENFLVKKFAEASAIDEDNKFLVGTGVGSPQGILPGAANALGLTDKASGAAAALTWDGLLALKYAIPSQYRANAVWIGSRSTYEAISKLRSNDNNYLWQPFQFVGGADGGPEKLMGFEVLEQEAMPDIGAGAFPLIFGDLAGYQIFDRVGMTVERFLDSATARQNMIIYVMRRRLGAQVIEPWRFAVQRVAST